MTMAHSLLQHVIQSALLELLHEIQPRYGELPGRRSGDCFFKAWQRLNKKKRI